MIGYQLSFVDLITSIWRLKMYDIMNDETKEWNIHSISSFLPLYMPADIKVINFPQSAIEDKILWGFAQYGDFSLKSSTQAMRKCTVHPKHKMLNWIRKLSLLPKIKIFLWLLLRQVIHSCDFPIVRKLGIKNMRYLCKQSSENIYHNFKYCLFV